MSLPQAQQQLIENLMALQDHYQAQLIEAQYKANLAIEQVSHVNALLVDQLGYQHTQSLIALRSHYQSQGTQHQQTATHAKAQLAHINALLADQIVLQQQQLISIPAPNTVEPPSEPLQLPTPSINLSKSTEHRELGEEGFPPQSARVAGGIIPPAISHLISSTEYFTTDEGSLKQGTLDLDKSVVPPSAWGADVTEEAPLGTFEHPNSAAKTSKPSQPPFQDSDDPTLFSSTKTPMLPQYQHLSKIQAVEKLLRDNLGSILHVDYIIRALYGEMDALAIKDEKPRMYDTLTQGTKKGLWVKVPDSPSCYTLDLKLVQPDSTAKQKSTASRSRRTSPARGKAHEELLPRYQHLNLTAAVESVVHEYAGEILTTEKIAKQLYGDLSGSALTLVKDKIGKTLWSGTRQGRWQHIPGQIGCYTLALNKLKK